MEVQLKPLRVLIVDDEPIARRVLREELELQPNLEIVGEADSGTKALAAIEGLNPDLLFLDLQMPGLGGFEVIQRLNRARHFPAIVIVTAYDQHAIRALDAGAIDYLLKPVPGPRLIQAIDRARQILFHRTVTAESLARLQEIDPVPGSTPVRKVVGKSGDEYFLLNVREILAFQAEGDAVSIITARHKYAATQSLRKIHEKLEGNGFERVHRNALVNVDHVRKMASLSSNRWLLTLDNGQEFIVSKRQARSVRQILNW